MVIDFIYILAQLHKV